MNAEEEQRLHNLEVAVMALFTHLIDGGLNIDAIHKWILSEMRRLS